MFHFCDPLLARLAVSKTQVVSTARSLFCEWTRLECAVLQDVWQHKFASVNNRKLAVVETCRCIQNICCNAPLFLVHKHQLYHILRCLRAVVDHCQKYPNPHASDESILSSITDMLTLRALFHFAPTDVYTSAVACLRHRVQCFLLSRFVSAQHPLHRVCRNPEQWMLNTSVFTADQHEQIALCMLYDETGFCLFSALYYARLCSLSRRCELHEMFSKQWCANTQSPTDAIHLQDITQLSFATHATSLLGMYRQTQQIQCDKILSVLPTPLQKPFMHTQDILHAHVHETPSGAETELGAFCHSNTSTRWNVHAEYVECVRLLGMSLEQQTESVRATQTNSKVLSHLGIKLDTSLDDEQEAAARQKKTRDTVQRLFRLATEHAHVDAALFLQFRSLCHTRSSVLELEWALHSCTSVSFRIMQYTCLCQRQVQASLPHAATADYLQVPRSEWFESRCSKLAVGIVVPEHVITQEWNKLRHNVARSPMRACLQRQQSLVVSDALQQIYTQVEKTEDVDEDDIPQHTERIKDLIMQISFFPRMQRANNGDAVACVELYKTFLQSKDAYNARHWLRQACSCGAGANNEVKMELARVYWHEVVHRSHFIYK